MDAAALAELERGDGTWENIQEVLRLEFLKLWSTVDERRRRNAKTEQRLRHLESALADKVGDHERFQQQELRVETLARAVGDLREALRHRDTAQSAFEASTSDSIRKAQDTTENQFAELESSFSTRVQKMEDACSSALERVERRLELIEDELSILVAAIDKKADVSSVDARLVALKRATDDAIRKRCKKTAVNSEIAALHDVLQRQHEAVETRLGDVLARVSALSEVQAQSAVQALAKRRDDELYEWQREYEERCAQHANVQSKQLEQSLRQHLEQQLADAVAVVHDSSVAAATKWLQEEQQKLHDLHERHVLSVQDQQERSHQRVKEELEHQLLKWKQSVSNDWTLLQAQVTESSGNCAAIAQLQADLARVQADLASTTEMARQELEQRVGASAQTLQAQFTAGIERAMVAVTKRSKEKRVAQEHMSTLSDKLSELDQIVKLVGKQLIQNTSQLQLVRREQQFAQRQARAAEDLALITHETLLLGGSGGTEEDGAGDAVQLKTAPPASRSSSNNSTHDRVDSNQETALTDAHRTDELQRLRTQHEALRDLIYDKLRDYQSVFSSSSSRVDT